MSDFSTEKSQATQLDRDDLLSKHREQFHLPAERNGQPCIYLCGNSLGLQPKSTADYVQRELEDWARLGVEGHFEARTPWLSYHEVLAEQTARLVGAKPTEVVVMNTLTVNLHLLMVSFYRPTANRHKILVEAGAFPSDQYAVKSQLEYHGFDPQHSLVELSPKDGESSVRTEDIETVLTEQGNQIALMLLGGVNYYSGQAFELERITTAARASGCVVGFDLAHAAGNVALHLHDWQVDFAVWCSYKYLNGGPGCTAGAFVHERHARTPALPRFAGWWGHDKQTRFLMGPEFTPIPGAEGWQVSNPAILPLAALRASMAMFDEAGMPALVAKSRRLTGYLESLLQQKCFDYITILTPDVPEQRGCQLSLRVKNGKQLHGQLKQNNVICDWREPDVIRVAPAPFYNTFSDAYNFVQYLDDAHHMA